MTNTPPASDPKPEDSKPEGPIKVQAKTEGQDQKAEQLYERHRHHRGLATALSVTIIGLSGGLFYALMDTAPDAPVLVLLSLDGWTKLLLGLSVVAAVLLQFFHVLGYLHFAYATGKQLKASIKPESERGKIYTELQAELDKAEAAFIRMELTVKIAVFSHLAGLVAVGIGHIW